MTRDTSSAPPKTGRLYLVPAPLDFGCLPLNAPAHAPNDVLPENTMAIAARLPYWLCENAKTLRANLKRISERHPLPMPIQEIHIEELPRAMHKKGDHAGSQSPAAPSSRSSPSSKTSHTTHLDPRPLLAPAIAGHDMGLASEAGMPAIADPGSSIVRAAHDLGIEVIPLVGPISLMLALAASGLNGQNFAFNGYLPQIPAQRAARIQKLEKIARHNGQSQIFIETPYRNGAMLDSLIQQLHPDTRLAISWGLTLQTQDMARNVSATIAQWRSHLKTMRPPQAIEALPAVYILGC